MNTLATYHESTLKRPIIVAAALTTAAFISAISMTSVGALEPQTSIVNAAGQQQSVSYIDQRYASDATFRAVLGQATGQEQGSDQLRYKDYQNGRAYWTPVSGVHSVNGQIYQKYLGLGGHQVLGEPTTDETQTPDGVGRYNHFRGTTGIGAASIYWTASTGSQLINGQVRDVWASKGWERGILGYPVTSQTKAPDGVSQYVNFQNGTIYQSPQYGTQYVIGEIYKKWGALGYDSGFLGKPITSEGTTPTGGKFTRFDGGMIYWSPATGAHSIQGIILEHYQSMGFEQSWLGYPTSDEYDTNGGKASNFEHGYIVYSYATGGTTVHRF
ncbi:hypothetical protein EON76_06300 [bacterium]|nr:MAG: hypothetical protein EON76_06300 [bacterium]